jgi:transposase
VVTFWFSARHGPYAPPSGEDSSLRRWGARGGKQAKNKAVVAVARKLAVLLHRLWITQEPYLPFYAEAA